LTENKPKIVCFSCKFGWGYLTDEAILSKQIENWVPIICTGKIDTTHIMTAFKQGADGVLILACPEGDCHYQDGNFEAKKRVHLLGELLKSMGIEKGRIRIEFGTDPEGKRIPQIIKEMSQDLAKLGSSKTSTLAAKKPAKEMIKVKGGK